MADRGLGALVVDFGLRRELGALLGLAIAFQAGLLPRLVLNRHPGQPPVYQIRVKGHLGPRWADWFEGRAITLEENGDTLLTGPVVDQAALHGLLRRVRDLGLPLLSVVRLEPG